MAAPGSVLASMGLMQHQLVEQAHQRCALPTRGEIRGSLAEAGRLGETLAQRLLDEGAAALVAALSGGAA